MSQRGASGSSLKGDRPVQLADIAAVYVVYLGRPNENPDQNISWIGSRLSGMVAAFASSEEFTDRLEGLLSTGRLESPYALSARERTQADRWLASVAPTHRLTPDATVGDLLLAALTIPELAAMAGTTVDPKVLELLAIEAEGRQLSRAKLQEVVTFDIAAFLSPDNRRRYRNADGHIDFDTTVSRSATPPVMLPMFTEGLEGLSRREPLTLGDWLTQTQTAALNGDLTHWLWDETTYLENRAALVEEAYAPATDGSAFLDFLATGDGLGISPHPLFSPLAYRTLNDHAPSEQRFDFRHYVFDGQRSGLRTSALFDPEFYLALNVHVQDQIASGHFGSALEHFVRVGMTAGYSFSPDFDRDFYLALYPDVAQNVAEGSRPSAEWHYIFHGAREGRTPNPFFDPCYYADRYPFIADEMRRLGIATTIEHFLLLGRARGWRAHPPLADLHVSPKDGKSLFEKRARRAFGEIMDGAVSIPPAVSPRLSVVLPVSGQAEFTAGFLKSAAFALETLAARRGIETEIIVVDNGGDDSTATLLEALPGVRIERFAKPMGFPAAVNAGARVARGDILLIANNDIEFQPDAFDRAVKALDDDPAIGVIGAKVILPNETLQEAGAMLDRLGSSHGFGRGVDPADVRGPRRVEVDYASACFVALRRSDFESLSGFDEAFSPGYFEDVDFALRMKRDLGKNTVVDTGLTVTHYEHASFSKGRPPSVSSALILRNRRRLKLAHSSLFQSMEVGNARQRARRARQALSGPARILIVLDTIPSARLSATAGRQEAILDAFTALGIPFDIVALTPSNRIDQYKDPRAKIFRAWMSGQSLDAVLNDHAGAYSHLWISGPANVARHAVAIWRAKADFDLIVVCDVTALPSQRTVERLRVSGAVIDNEAVLSMADDDLIDTLDVDVWVSAHEQSRALIDRLGRGPAIKIGYGSAYSRTGEGRPLAERDAVVFAESADHGNSAACDELDWLLREVWPRLQGMENVRLNVVGAWPADVAEDFVRRFADRVDFRGDLRDDALSELYSRSCAVLVPGLQSADAAEGALRALSENVPVVMTNEAAQNLGLAAALKPPRGSKASRAKSPDQAQPFADTLSTLYADEARWEDHLEHQKAAAARWSDMETFVARIRDTLMAGDSGAAKN